MAVQTSIHPSETLLARNRNLLTVADLFWLVPFIILVGFPVVWQISALPVMLWDESRQAVNAAEMVANGNLIVTYFQGNPDMWNTKPPFQIWLMALSIKLFGYSELALRLPTIGAVLSTFFLLFWFGLQAFKNKLIAALSVLILVSSKGYMIFHVARTADYDAMLVFFIVLYTFTFFLYLEENKQKYWWFCVLGLTLAVLTKGVAGLMCAPALLIYIIYRGKLLTLLRQPAFYAGVAFFLFLGLGYYFLRETMNPGYLQAVYENELGGRYLTALDDLHKHPADWYLQNIRKEKYKFWLPVLLLSVWVLLWQSAVVVKRFAVLAIVLLGLYLLIISTAQTKLYWYDAPAYPFMAVLIALGVTILLQGAAQLLNVKHTAFFFTGSVLLLCLLPYNAVLEYYLKDKAEMGEKYPESMFGPALKLLEKQFPQEKQITLLQPADQYPAISHYYKLAYQQKGYTFREANQFSVSGLQPGEIVVLVNPAFSSLLEANFEAEVLHQYYSSRVYRIVQKKNNHETNE
ncbi:ArnT family glycosyltransferase [Adhaeribacter terreus]|uniref:ArnT family glycosyltransferase n=1 Tax=Adhaeribacter terreus TaxID=529703 RepID=A0ABW0E8W3_9BACT